MNSIQRALTIGLCCAAANLYAATPAQRAEVLYGGIGLGLSQLNPQENGSGWHTVEKSDSGYGLYIGYPINARWFAELTYTDLGAATVAPRNTTLSTAQEISYQVPSLSAGYYFWQPSETVFTYLRAGVAAIVNKNSGDTDIYEQNTSAQITLGLGVEWRFSSQVFTRLELTSYDVDAQIVLLSVGCWIND
jgi:large repetitive protein